MTYTGEARRQGARGAGALGRQALQQRFHQCGDRHRRIFIPMRQRQRQGTQHAQDSTDQLSARLSGLLARRMDGRGRPVNRHKRQGQKL